MAVSMVQARRLCTQRELELVDASRPQHMKELTPARLKQKITRARALRDKYRDLSKRQRLEARGKKRPQGGRPAQGNENTRRKAELFAEVLERFQAGLDRAERRETEPAAKRAGAKKGVAKRARKGAKKRARKGASGGAQAREMAEPRSPGASAMKGARRRTAGAGRADGSNRGTDRSRAAHTRSAGRRGQAKRDRR
jgi:hypothetical protein